MLATAPSPTCAHHSCKDPALPVLDRLPSGAVPLLEDGGAAAPLAGAGAPGIVLAPIAQEDPGVIIAVDLERRKEVGARSPEREGGPPSKLAPGCPSQLAPGCPGHSSYHGAQHPADIDRAAAQGRVLHWVVLELQVAVQQLQADADRLFIELQERNAAERAGMGQVSSSLAAFSSLAATIGRLFPKLAGGGEEGPPLNCDATARWEKGS